MKRFLLFCAICIVVYACDKETDPVYDSHLFQALQAQSWVFDSAKVTDSLNRDTFLYAQDSVEEITRFSSQQYFVNNVILPNPPMTDTIILDTLNYQIIYDSPSRIYFYNAIDQQLLKNQYIDIDTVNEQLLILTKTDTFKNVSRNYYHAF